MLHVHKCIIEISTTVSIPVKLQKMLPVHPEGHILGEDYIYK